MKQPLTAIVDGVTYVRGHIFINGKVYVPVSELPKGYNPPEFDDETRKTLEEVAHQIRVRCHEQQRPVTVAEMKRILSRNIHHRFVPDFLKLAEDTGYIQRIAGTSGETAEYLPVQQGN